MPSKHRFPKNANFLTGFTMIEIMVVITLIGLITATVSVSVWRALVKGQTDTAHAQANELAKSIAKYRLTKGRFPSSSEGFSVLVDASRGPPILARIPRDPWGKSYVLRVPGLKNPYAVDVVSAGPDGQWDTDDDVGNWPEEMDNP
ncbi:MAG: type II secretion system major pseudopilin GspG [Deltaproteobacteria bacterium]|nr:type II secretion system major pseudopilin GspG [Deltaproteobacteria bacterium]